MNHDGHDHPDEIDCSATLYRIMEYLDGEMTAEDTLRIAAHLQGCAPCLAQHDLDRMMKAVVKRSCTREQAPATLRTTIMQSITDYGTHEVHEYTEIRQYRVDD